MAFSTDQFLIFWIIRIVVLMAFIITGYQIRSNIKNLQSYWKVCLPLMVIYSLAEGLRWDRGTDYNHYYYEMTTGSSISELSEPLYSQWISFIHNTGIPYWVVFVFYSFILLYAFLCLIKRLPNTANIALPLFFLISSMQSENLIRQFFALSFIIFALVALYDRRYLLMLFLIVVSEGIHFSALFPIFIILICFLLSKYYNPKRPIVAASLFVILYLFWDVSYFSSFMDPILRMIPETNTKMDSYVQSATWFNEEGGLSLLAGSQYTGRSLSKTLVQFPTYLFIIIGGFYASKENNYFRMCYWVAYIAILLDITRGDIEAYLRFFHWLAFIISIIVGLLYTELHINKTIKQISIIFLLVYYLWGLMLCNLFVVDPEGYAFIWDR